MPRHQGRRTAGGLPGLDIAEQRSWQHYLRSAFCFDAMQNRRLAAEHDLAVIDLKVLETLRNSVDGSARMGELAGELGLAPTHLTKRIRRLAGQGLVRREPIPGDGRGVQAALSDLGRTVIPEATATYARGVQTQLVGPLSRAQVGAMAKYCSRIGAGAYRVDADLSLGELPGLDDVELSFWRRFVVSSEGLLAGVNGAVTDAHRLTMLDIHVLGLLARSRGASVRMSELAAPWVLLPSRVSQQISRLEAQGLVRRTVGRPDGRVVHVWLTGEGRRRAGLAAATCAQQIRAHYLDPLSRPQVIALGDNCRRISAALQAGGAPVKFTRT